MNAWKEYNVSTYKDYFTNSVSRLMVEGTPLVNNCRDSKTWNHIYIYINFLTFKVQKLDVSDHYKNNNNNKIQ